MEKNKRSIWGPVLLAWLLSAIIIPFLPELFSRPWSRLLAFPWEEYAATIGLFAAVFALYWLPLGIFLSRRQTDRKRTLQLVGTGFVFLVICWGLIFAYLWNS